MSRKREYLADAGSVELTKNPDAMISALRKIAGHSEIHAPAQIQEMFLDHPRGDAASPACSPPIRRSRTASPRWSATPAATTSRRRHRGTAARRAGAASRLAIAGPARRCRGHIRGAEVAAARPVGRAAQTRTTRSVRTPVAACGFDR